MLRRTITLLRLEPALSTPVIWPGSRATSSGTPGLDRRVRQRSVQAHQQPGLVGRVRRLDDIEGPVLFDRGAPWVNEHSVVSGIKVIDVLT